MQERIGVQAPVDDREAFLDQVADAICRYGLRLPTLLALQIGHPVTFLGEQLLWIAQPALSLLMPGDVLQRLATVLEEPQAIEGLQARLEASEAQV